MRTPTDIVLPRGAAESVARGHPWVWRDAIGPRPPKLDAGAEVHLVDRDGRRLARGLFDPGSPLAVRVWGGPDEAFGPALVAERLARALAARAALVPGIASGETDAYRLVHGEGDRMPGFVVDRYGALAVLKADGDAARARRDEVARALREGLEREGVRTLVLREGGRGEAPRLEVAFGPAPPDVTTVREHGVPFVVDVARGQKTGAFLDQRDNRRRVGELARGRRVLNLFSYAGGFSLHAALGGAARVTSVDVASAAHASAQESFRAAGIDPRPHAFVAADAFAFLADAKRRGDAWDLVVSDPPSFAPSERAVGRAVTAYRALHRACADVLSPGGVFCAASCSSHVPMDMFLATLDDAALGRADLRVAELRGAGADHPTLPAFPEGRYLKFVVLA